MQDSEWSAKIFATPGRHWPCAAIDEKYGRWSWCSSLIIDRPPLISASKYTFMRICHLPTLVGFMLSFISTSFANTSSGTNTAPWNEWISITTEGEGPDLILIPGLASSREVWSKQAVNLRKNYKLHLVQISGFAESAPVTNTENGVAKPAAQAIANYIRDEHILTPAIIGHSLGGEIALMLGARYPELVGSLTIVDALPFYSLLFDPRATPEIVKPRAEMIRKAMIAASSDQTLAAQTEAIANLVKTEAERPAIVRSGMQSDRKTVANATYELMTTDLRSELKHIRAPVKVIYAYDAAYGIPPAAVDSMYKDAYHSASKVIFQRIDGSFHFIMLDQPDQFERELTEFLKQTR